MIRRKRMSKLNAAERTLKISKLIDGWEHFEQCHPFPCEDISNRCTGKTTAIALEAIGKAMLNPDETTIVVETAPNRRDQNSYDRALLYVIRNCISKLGLKHLEVTLTHMSRRIEMRYNIFAEYKGEVEVKWKLVQPKSEEVRHDKTEPGIKWEV
jgi:hypothetical protein